MTFKSDQNQFDTEKLRNPEILQAFQAELDRILAPLIV